MLHEFTRQRAGAVGVALADDLSRGLDPRGRRSEDADDWAPLLRIFEKHSEINVSQLNASASQFKEFAVQFTLLFRAVSNDNVAPDQSVSLPQPALMAVGF